MNAIENALYLKIKNNFDDSCIVIQADEEVNALIATELGELLFSIPDDSIHSVLGFLLSHYLIRHPESLANDSGYISLMYYINIINCIDKQSTLSDFASKVLSSFSINQLEIILEWISIAENWNCSGKFGLDESKSGWRKYLKWRIE